MSWLSEQIDKRVLLMNQADTLQDAIDKQAFASVKENIALEAELAALKKLTDRLPRYEDTGEPFVPWLDHGWVIDRYGNVKEILSLYEINTYGEHVWDIGLDEAATGKVYSTKEAAEAANEK